MTDSLSWVSQGIFLSEVMLLRPYLDDDVQSSFQLTAR